MVLIQLTMTSNSKPVWVNPNQVVRVGARFVMIDSTPTEQGSYIVTTENVECIEVLETASTVVQALTDNRR